MVALVLGGLVVGCRAQSADRYASPSIAVDLQASPQRVELTGLDDASLDAARAFAPNDSRWPSFFAVYVARDSAPANAEPTSDDTPPVIGRYVVSDDAIRFEPRFPFTAGTSYRVDVDLEALAERRDRPSGRARSRTGGEVRPPLTHRFVVASVERPRSTRVIAVHPSAARLPSNLLRWYVETSAPMAPGEALAHIHLMDESGREVRGAFLALDQELWNPDRTRLTLLFDPGRVKRGIRTNVESGAPLVAGRRYRLVIDDAWRDGAGAQLASGFEYAFEAAEADRRSPDPSSWRLTPPRAGTRAPLAIAFGEPLDHALASRLLVVEDSIGAAVPGTVTVAEGDSAWTFQPTRDWTPGAYTLRVGGALEDLAGNNLVRVFDVDRRVDPGGVDRDVAGAVRTIRFRIE